MKLVRTIGVDLRTNYWDDDEKGAGIEDKLLVLLSISVCFLSLLRTQFYFDYVGSSGMEREVRNMGHTFMGDPKIAFLFLTRRDLPLDFLWDSFFENVESAKFSVYINTEPGFLFNESSTRSKLFYDRQLRNSIKVSWGEASMIEAERLLFHEALQDPANQRFILLSDSCIPLYNFSYIYNYLMSSPRSYVDSFIVKKDTQYNPLMTPIIPKKNWRKGSQWVALVRKHAEAVVDDKIILPLFKKFCKRRPLVDASLGKKNDILQKQHNCIPDEHYVQTLLAMNEVEDELERRTVTYSMWNQSASNKEPEGWHPVTFRSADSTPQLIDRIKEMKHVYYESEVRTEWCKNNSTYVPCFLFGRKFSGGAAMRLLSEGLLM